MEGEIIHPQGWDERPALLCVGLQAIPGVENIIGVSVEQMLLPLEFWMQGPPLSIVDALSHRAVQDPQ